MKAPASGVGRLGSGSSSDAAQPRCLTRAAAPYKTSSAKPLITSKSSPIELATAQSGQRLRLRSITISTFAVSQVVFAIALEKTDPVATLATVSAPGWRGMPETSTCRVSGAFAAGSPPIDAARFRPRKGRAWPLKAADPGTVSP
ncbi:MAG: hypothetical protein WAS26_00440 [Paracoccaceae bacterium]